MLVNFSHFPGRRHRPRLAFRQPNESGSDGRVGNAEFAQTNNTRLQ